MNDTLSIVAATPSVAGAAFKNPVDGFVANADFGATDRPNPAFWAIGPAWSPSRLERRFFGRSPVRCAFIGSNLLDGTDHSAKFQVPVGVIQEQSENKVIHFYRTVTSAKRA